jgi:hypothetical protein
MWQKGVEGYPDVHPVTGWLSPDECDGGVARDDGTVAIPVNESYRPFGEMVDDDWDRRPSELAEEAANRIWDMPLSEIYASHPDPRVSMWCEWIQQAVYTQWLKDQEGNE